MTVVLDTNVLVSGLISGAHAPGRIVDFLRAGRIRLAVDDRILDEYHDVLRRPYFRRYFTIHEANRVLAFIAVDSVHVVCSEEVNGLPDADDACFAETALAANAPLVTGNHRHFPAAKWRGIQVLSPAQFLASIPPADR